VAGANDRDRPLVAGAQLAADEQQRGTVVDAVEVDRVSGVKDGDERDAGRRPALDVRGGLRDQRLGVDREQGRLTPGAVERGPQRPLGIAA
jgi:hypothetical protein